MTEWLYLLAAVLFILGIKNLTRIKTARRGNVLAALAMLLAVVTTLVRMETIGWMYIGVGVLAGGLIGAVVARRVAMTAMPELVAVFNGFGGGASLVVALAFQLQQNLPKQDVVTVVLSVLIGGVTFSGSLVAFAKLKGIISAKPIIFPGQQHLNAFIGVMVFGFCFILVLMPQTSPYLTSFLLFTVALALLLGFLLVIPIGGADMPVVISLLNSYSGLAAAATGFVLKNVLLVGAGALVGASGLILTRIMCKAMNRSLLNVLFGGVGQDVQSVESSGYTKVKESSPEEAVLMLEAAKRVIFVPGYGMAVAQAQFACQELGELLEKNGVDVRYAIHPVAGRMPGHMNVLLAEANVPYEKLFELDHINTEFKQTDIVIVIGANDVVNPAAGKDKASPIYGMPILKAYESGTVFVIKRSLSPGFAGIKNELFENENTLMLFGDAKAIMQKLVQEFEEL